MRFKKGMDKMNIINNIVSYLLTNWISTLSFIIGALITSFLTYIFSKKRENSRLIIELRTKATEQLLEGIKGLTDCFAKLSMTDFSFINEFNLTIDKYKKSLEIAEKSYSDEAITQFWLSNIKQSYEYMNKYIIDFTLNWMEYYKYMFAIIGILETKLVMLYKFKGFMNLFLYEIKKVSKMQDKIFTTYSDKIHNKILYKENLDNNDISTLIKHQNEFIKELVNIQTVLIDLTTGLQNEYLSKLFKQKINYRQVKDKIIPIYKPGFIFDPVKYERQEILAEDYLSGNQ